MSKKTANITNQPTFQLKGTMLAITVFELAHFNIERLTQELTQKIKEAPEFFETIPMVLGIDKLDIPLTKVELKGLLSLFKEYHIQLMALRTDNEAAIAMANKLGLVVLPPTGAREKLIELAASRTPLEEVTAPAATIEHHQTTDEQPATLDNRDTEEAQQQLPIDDATAVQVTSESPKAIEAEIALSEEVKTITETTTAPTEIEASKEPVVVASKIVSHPVRSGQQIEELSCDLIITANVSTGAELITDGNIHIYGTMRGRAMAGFHGNNKARVFCHKLTAELISIAGVVITEEELRRHPLWGKAAQVGLELNQIIISAL